MPESPEDMPHHVAPSDLQILVGNKCDMDEHKRAVPFSRGQALANEFGIKFFETSAKSNINVEEVRWRRLSVFHNIGLQP